MISSCSVILFYTFAHQHACRAFERSPSEGMFCPESVFSRFHTRLVAKGRHILVFSGRRSNKAAHAGSI